MTRHIPRKRFGQHFLHDKRVIQRIIDSLAIHEDDIWVEIGPGQGALTDELPRTIRHLYLIELDRDLAARLTTQYQDDSTVSVINQDILTVAFDQFAMDHQRVRLLGNLPYNISTPIFFHLANFTHCIKDMTFMVQKEVADRLVARPATKEYGRLSVSAGLRFETVKLFDVGPGAFNPPPKVKSSIIRLRPHLNQPQPDVIAAFDTIVKAAFLKRRKTLRNALAGQVESAGFDASGIDPQLRAENLSITDFLKLADQYANAIIRTDKGPRRE